MRDLKVRMLVGLGAAMAAIAVGLGIWATNGSGNAQASVDQVTVPAEFAGWVADGMKPEAKQLIESGGITRQQYIDAVNANVECYRAAGVPVLDPKWEGEKLQVTAGPFSSRAELDNVKPAMDQCYIENLRGIDVIWQTSGNRVYGQ